LGNGSGSILLILGSDGDLEHGVTEQVARVNDGSTQSRDIRATTFVYVVSVGSPSSIAVATTRYFPVSWPLIDCEEDRILRAVLVGMLRDRLGAAVTLLGLV
jgi:hypothetical protein